MILIAEQDNENTGSDLVRIAQSDNIDMLTAWLCLRTVISGHKKT